MVRLSEYLIVTVAIGWVLWGMGTVFTRWRSGLRYLLVLGERLQGMGTGHVLAGESAATRDNAAAGWPMPEPLRLFPDGGAADAVPRRVPRPTTPAA
jgi:hypothetical protein